MVFRARQNGGSACTALPHMPSGDGFTGEGNSTDVAHTLRDLARGNSRLSGSHTMICKQSRWAEVEFVSSTSAKGCTAEVGQNVCGTWNTSHGGER